MRENLRLLRQVAESLHRLHGTPSAPGFTERHALLSEVAEFLHQNNALRSGDVPPEASALLPFLSDSAQQTPPLSPSGRRAAVLRDLIEHDGLTFSDCVRAFATEEDDPYVSAARTLYADGSDDDLEIDDHTVCLGSHSPGGRGKFVMAWVYVRDEDLACDEVVSSQADASCHTPLAGMSPSIE